MTSSTAAPDATWSSRAPATTASRSTPTTRGTQSSAGRDDLVNAELTDAVRTDCEVVVRQLSRDQSAGFPAQLGTQVEPDSLAAGSTIVTAFQSGRLVEGGAAVIAWASSRDAGRTWRRGFLEYPGRVSDPVVAYDDARRTWLIAALGAADRNAALLIARSSDGVAWTPLRSVVDDATRRTTRSG